MSVIWLRKLTIKLLTFDTSVAKFALTLKITFDHMTMVFMIILTSVMLSIFL